MVFKTWLIHSSSLYKKWDVAEINEWKEIYNMGFVDYFFHKGFHIYAICLSIGMVAATFLNANRLGNKYDLITGLVINICLPIFASVLLAYILRYLTQRSYEISLKN